MTALRSITARVGLVLLTLLFALVGLLLPAEPAAAQSPTLTGEQFAFQSATGPYAGGFIEDGSGTLGTQPGANGRVPVLSLTAQFRVPADAATPVTGTKTFLAGFSSGDSSPCSPGGAIFNASNLVYVATLPDGTTDIGLSSLSVGGGVSGAGVLEEDFTSVSALQRLQRGKHLTAAEADAFMTMIAGIRSAVGC